MTIQLSDAVRTARVDAIESTIGTSAKLRLYSGSQPANCAAAATGTLLCEISLPSDWMANGAAGVKSKSGTWSGTGAAAASTGTAAGYFRIMDSTGTTCHEQGKVGAVGDGTADMTLDNVSIAQNQAVTVATFTHTDANA